MPFRAAIFDLDGTLVDNMRFHGEAWMAFCRRHGISAELSTFERDYAGKRNEEILPLLFGRPFSPEEARTLAEEKEADYRRAYGPHVAFVPGAEELLRLLRQAAIQTAIASAAPPLNRKLVIDTLGLAPLFEAVIGGEQVKHGKPAPDLFLAAAAAIGIPPRECIAFEDAINGVRSAKAAGMFTVGVTTLTAADALREAGADATVRDFRELLAGPLRAEIFGA